jgi:hypothetical protein
MADLKRKIRENSEILSTCIYIAFAIAITQVVSSQIQKYYIDNTNYFSAFIMFIFIVVMYGILIFILVKISKPFRNFLLRMFGVESETLKENPDKQNKESVNIDDKKATENSLDYDCLIEDLIEKIDNEKSLFTVRDELHGYGMTLYIVGIFLFLAVIISYLPDNITPFIGRMTLVIAIAAVIFSFVTYSSRGMENNVLDANFGKAIKKFKIEKKDEEKRLLLKALLKMKVINSKYKLGIVKGMHPKLFTKEKLLEKLYEK